MELDRETGLIESILFLESDPLDLSALSRISGFSREVVSAAINRIRQAYQAPMHGMELTEIGEGFVFAPKQAHWSTLKSRYGKKNISKLSKAALETLSIIAYAQPVTKPEIESIRGVAADGMIKLLMARSLVKEVGKKDAPGRPIQYGTTKDFLRFFRLSSIADLPKLDELEKERFEVNE